MLSSVYAIIIMIIIIIIIILNSRSYVSDFPFRPVFEKPFFVPYFLWYYFFSIFGNMDKMRFTFVIIPVRITLNKKCDIVMTDFY